MIFKADRTKLAEAVFNASKACAVKTTFNALDGILLSLKGNKLIITGYDLEMGIKVILNVDGEMDGSVILDARLFGDIIRRMPTDLPLEIIVKDEKDVTIKSGKIKFSIQCSSGSNFPNIIDLNDNLSLNMNEKVLKSMLSQVCHAIAQTDVNPILMGALFCIENNLLSIVASDGSRLALRREIMNHNDISFIVPEKAIVELNRNLSEDNPESEIKISIDRNQICFSKENYIIFSRLLDGKFLDYNRITDFKPERIATVNVRETIASLERCSLLITEKFKSPVVCNFINIEQNSAVMHFSCKTNLGEIEEDISVKFESFTENEQIEKAFEIAFNPKFMLDALKNTNCDEVKIFFSTELKPIKIVPPGEDGFLFIVVPIRQKK